MRKNVIFCIRSKFKYHIFLHEEKSEKKIVKNERKEAEFKFWHMLIADVFGGMAA